VKIRLREMLEPPQSYEIKLFGSFVS